MSTASFEQAVFLKEHADEIKQLSENFRRTFCKFSSNTLHQFTNFDIISRGYELMDYVINGDLTPTTIKKLNELMKDMSEADNNPEFKAACDVFSKAASIISKKIKEKI